MFSTSNILDTLRLDSSGFFLKKFHAQRTFEAFQEIHNPVTYENIYQIYTNIEQQLLTSFKDSKLIRIVFQNDGIKYKVTEDELIPVNLPVKLELSSKSEQLAGLGLQNFKWENRIFWQTLLQKKSLASDDIISLNTLGEVTETSRFNVFLFSKAEDLVFTPPLSSGCINGVYRRFVFAEKSIQLPELGKKKVLEKSILGPHLSQYQLFVANSVRGVLPAKVVS